MTVAKTFLSDFRNLKPFFSQEEQNTSTCSYPQRLITICQHYTVTAINIFLSSFSHKHQSCNITGEFSISINLIYRDPFRYQCSRDKGTVEFIHHIEALGDLSVFGGLGASCCLWNYHRHSKHSFCVICSEKHVLLPP